MGETWPYLIITGLPQSEPDSVSQLSSRKPSVECSTVNWPWPLTEGFETIYIEVLVF